MNIKAIGSDIKHSCRALARRPGYTAAAVLCVGLGISASVAVFTLVRSELLRPLPYRDPRQLVSIAAVSKRNPNGVVLDPEFAAWRQENRTLSGLAAWNDTRYILTGGAESEEVTAGVVNGEFLDVLGVRPALGRGFALADDQQKRPVVILGHKLWARSFNADPASVGRIVLLDNQPYEIIGILPDGFRFPALFQPDLLLPGGYSLPP